MVVVNGVAQKEKIDFIVRQEVLLYGPTHMDLTNNVIREYEKRYPSNKKGKGKGKK
jgi:Skp family chaperone for outer membrane proteins